MRLIDADALVEHIKDIPTWWADGGGVYPGSMKYPEGMYDPEDIISCIDNEITIEAVPVVHGEWKNGCCTNCGQVDFSKPNFCSNCGADMRKGGANQ